MSSRELSGLVPPDGWRHAGVAEDDRQLFTPTGRGRRRSSHQKTAVYTQLDDSSPSSSQPSPSVQSSTAPTPPSLPSTARTGFSAYDSGSELSSVPGDLSDGEFSPERAPKRRKIEVPTPPPRISWARKQLKKTSLVGATSPEKKTLQSSLIVILKLGSEKLEAIGSHSLQHDVQESSAQLPQLPGTLESRTAHEVHDPRMLTSLEGTNTQTESDGPSIHQLSSTPPQLDVPESSASSFEVGVQTAPSTTQLPNGPRKRGRKTSDISTSPTTYSTLEPTAALSIPEHALQVQQRPPDPIPPELQLLVETSKRLMNLSSRPIQDKPAPIGTPEVWADGRQALCEALPYYRAYQSAGYCTGGFAYSFMFDQEGSPRDYMDSEVVIARAGGGLSKDKDTGKMARQADQTESSQVRSVRNSMVQFNPVAILSGKRNLQCPTKMPHVYNVLDWFKPTHIWFEKVNGMANIRYRFEKLRKEKQSWWASSDGPEPTSVGEQSPPEVRRCTKCSHPSQQVYLQGWMCLQPECSRFWKLDSGDEPQEAGLLYDPRFLKQHTPWPHASEPQPLRPKYLTLGPTPMLGEDVAWAAAKGLVCPQCGRCNSREAWEAWQCGNPNCGFTYSLPHANVPAHALHDPYSPLTSGYAISKDWFSPVLPLRVEFAHNYRINYFTIPGVDGFIAHFIANKTVNEEADGPDDMWTELQTADVGLRRRPLGCSTLQGPMLTQHFAVNYGMPYKFIAATESRSFNSACRAVTDTRSRLNWAARHCVGNEIHKPEAEFNELLALGYFERQKIDYHDDGEFGLGPTIATLSIGAPASMKVRLKAKHHHGISKAGAYVNRPPIPGCLMYEERKAAHEQLDALKREDEEAYKARLKSLPSELELQSKGHSKDVLNMHLCHGDIVIMHGAKIQEYYEHAVDPIGKLRFALTCRYIDGDSLKHEDRPTYEVEPDTGGYDGSRLPFLTL